MHLQPLRYFDEFKMIEYSVDGLKMFATNTTKSAALSETIRTVHLKPMKTKIAEYTVEVIPRGKSWYKGPMKWNEAMKHLLLCDLT
jgi:hypothetical protein